MGTADDCNNGKILRVKAGYNPNSSSVGSQVPALLVFLVGSGALVALTLHTFGCVEKLLRKRRLEKSAKIEEDLNWIDS